MSFTLVLVGFILCALASFLGAFFGVRSLSDNAKPLRIPIYSDIVEAAERKRDEGSAKENQRLLNEYFFGEEKRDDMS